MPLETQDTAIDGCTLIEIVTEYPSSSKYTYINTSSFPLLFKGVRDDKVLVTPGQRFSLDCYYSVDDSWRLTTTSERCEIRSGDGFSSYQAPIHYTTRIESQEVKSPQMYHLRSDDQLVQYPQMFPDRLFLNSATDAGEQQSNHLYLDGRGWQYAPIRISPGDKKVLGWVRQSGGGVFIYSVKRSLSLRRIKTHSLRPGDIFYCPDFLQDERLTFHYCCPEDSIDLAVTEISSRMESRDSAESEDLTEEPLPIDIDLSECRYIQPTMRIGHSPVKGWISDRTDTVNVYSVHDRLVFLRSGSRTYVVRPGDVFYCPSGVIMTYSEHTASYIRCRSCALIGERLNNVLIGLGCQPIAPGQSESDQAAISGVGIKLSSQRGQPLSENRSQAVEATLQNLVDFFIEHGGDPDKLPALKELQP